MLMSTGLALGPGEVRLSAWCVHTRVRLSAWCVHTRVPVCVVCAHTCACLRGVHTRVCLSPWCAHTCVPVYVVCACVCLSAWCAHTCAPVCMVCAHTCAPVWCVHTRVLVFITRLCFLPSMFLLWGPLGQLQALLHAPVPPARPDLPCLPRTRTHSLLCHVSRQGEQTGCKPSPEQL